MRVSRSICLLSHVGSLMGNVVVKTLPNQFLVTIFFLLFFLKEVSYNISFLNRLFEILEFLP